MKKIYATLIAVFAIIYVSSAQNTYPWPLNGSIGIGTNTPNEHLSIAGNGSVGNISLVPGTTTYAGYKLVLTTQAANEGFHMTMGGTKIMSAYGYNDADEIGFGNLGHQNLLYLNSSGHVGVGTTSPAGTFHVYGTNSTNAIIESAGNTQAYMQFNANGNTSYIGPSANNGLLSNISNGDMVMRSFGSLHLSANNAGSPQLTLTGGFVGIGTTTPQEALSVNGNIRSKQVKVELNSWPDYVFKPTYVLPSLLEVKIYIDKYQHLPDMPSEAEVAKEGLNLGDINKLLTKKVEELTLYLIEQDKKIDDQHHQLIELKEQMAAITKSLTKN